MIEVLFVVLLGVIVGFIEAVLYAATPYEFRKQFSRWWIPFAGFAIYYLWRVEHREALRRRVP